MLQSVDDPMAYSPNATEDRLFLQPFQQEGRAISPDRDSFFSTSRFVPGLPIRSILPDSPRFRSSYTAKRILDDPALIVKTLNHQMVAQCLGT
jgi:hypothetical protein